ncbi:MAG: ComEC/Rec2 family competence protein [Bacteroidia bacterium]
MSFIHRFPLLWVAFGLVIGVWAAEKGLPYLPHLGGIALLGFVFLYFFNQKYPSFRNEKISVGMLILAAVGLGAWGMEQQKPDTSLLEPLKNQTLQWVGVIDGKVKQKVNGRSTTIQTFGYWRDSSFVPMNCKLRVWIDSATKTKVEKYDSVYFVAKTSELKSKYPAYLQYLHRNQVFLSARVYQIAVKGKANSVAGFAFQIQQKLSNQLLSLFSDTTTGAITVAMFLGEEHYLEEDAQQKFAKTGVSHILAISGQHFAVLYLLLNWLLSFLQNIKYGKKGKYLIILALLIFYALLCGAAASIVRAVAMYIFIILAKILNRRHETLNLLGASAVLQIFFKPMIIFNLGFQLSYMAVLGIVLLYPIFENFFRISHPIGKHLVEWIGITFCAQLCTTPFILMAFGTFPTYFLLANILVAFVAMPLTYVGFLLVFFAYIPFINRVLAFISHYLLLVMQFLVDKIAALPHALISKDDYFGIVIVCVQIVLAVGILYLIKHFKAPQFEDDYEPALTSWGLN